MHHSLSGSLPESAAQLLHPVLACWFCTFPHSFTHRKMPCPIPDLTSRHLYVTSLFTVPPWVACRHRSVLWLQMWTSQFIRILLWWESDGCHYHGSHEAPHSTIMKYPSHSLEIGVGWVWGCIFMHIFINIFISKGFLKVHFSFPWSEW